MRKMNNTINLPTENSADVSTYWEILKNLSNDMKCQLAKMLTASIAPSSSKLTDTELQEALSGEKDFASCNHNELSDEQFKKITRTSTNLNKNLKRWL